MWCYSSYRPISFLSTRKSICTYPSGAHSTSTWQVLQTSTVWFCCWMVYYRCHISLEIVGSYTKILVRELLFAVQFIGLWHCSGCFVLELTLEVSISPTSSTLITQSFLPMIQRNGTMFFSEFWGISRRYEPPHKLAKNEDPKYWNWRRSKNSPYWQSSSRDSIQVYLLGLWYRLRRQLLPRDTQTPGHHWFHYGPTWQRLASAKT